MSGVFEFEAVVKTEAGAKAAKVTRRQGDVPAVIYGGGKAPEAIALSHSEVLR